MNKLLQLKKQEIEVDSEYAKLKERLNKRTNENQEKHAELTIKYDQLLDDLQQNEMQVIDKLQAVK